MSLPPESGETPPRRRIGEVFGGFASPNPGVPGGHSVVDAVAFLRQKAGQGDAEAQFQLAVIYQNGRLVPQDQPQAREWLLKAAEQGHVKAMFNLGVTYGDGLGVPVETEARSTTSSPSSGLMSRKTRTPTPGSS